MKDLTKYPKLTNWEYTRAKKVKPHFIKLNIKHCELRYESCTGEIEGFAHSLKRKYIITQELMEEVIGACDHCHHILEYKFRDKMADIVREVIKNRENTGYSEFEEEFSI